MFETFRESRRRKTEKNLANYNNPNYQAKEEFDTLKILSLLNNTENHQASDFKFKDSLVKEYIENINKIKAHKEKTRKSFEACNNIAIMPHSHFLTMEQKKRLHKMNLNDAYNLCIQNKDIAINLLTCGANQINERVCGVTRELEKYHCRGFVPMQLLSESCGFIKTFHAAINQMLHKPKDGSISFLESAFSSKCKLIDKSCQGDRLDTKCTDANENLIRNVLITYLDHDFEIPDFRKSYTQRYCYFLAKEYDNLSRRTEETLKEMQEINDANGGRIFIKHEDDDERLKEEPVAPGEDEQDLVYNEREDLPPEIILPSVHNQSFIENEVIKESMVQLQMYKDIKRAFIGHLEKADASSIKFVEEYLIKYIPHVIHERQSINRKALYIYQKFYDYSIWILAYGMLITLIEELKESHECTIDQFIIKASADKAIKRKCKIDNKLGFQFPYSIFKTYFKEYVLKTDDDRLAEDASGMDLDDEDDDEPKGPKPDGPEIHGKMDFGVSNFFGFGKKK